ncbi:MAG: tetratricopeptide repeat protein [Spirosomataceae bacterium]
MKTLFSFISFSFFAFQGFGQASKPEAKPASSVNLHENTYRLAKKRGDAYTAIVSLNYLLASGGPTNYADTLAQWYMYSENYVQASLLTDELLLLRPQDESLLSIKATSLRALNKIAESAEVYNKLFQMTKNYLYGVELVQLQWTLKRLLECQQTAQSLRTLTYKPEQTLRVPTPDNKSQETIGVSAFAWYMEGLSYLGENQTDKAKDAFQKALSITSPFSLATFQLTEIEKMAPAEKK